MIAVSAQALEKDVNGYINQVNDDYETLMVTGDKKSVVIIPEEVYNNIMENLYLTSSKANYEHLMRSLKQAEEGSIAEHELIEVEEDE